MLKGTGLWLFWPRPGTGEPGFFTTFGHFVNTIDPEGNSTFELLGRIEEICPELG